MFRRPGASSTLSALAGSLLLSAVGVAEDSEAYGLRFVPVETSNGTAIAYDPEDFQIHATTEFELDREIVVAADQVSSLPEGDYRLFLEGPGLISPTLISLLHRPEPSSASRIVRAPVVASGRLRPELGMVHPGRQLTMRFLRVDLLLGSDGGIPIEMSRRATIAEAREGVSMPAGETIAALVDGSSDEYLGLSPVVKVLAGSNSTIELRTPRRGEAALVLSLSRHDPAGLMEEASQVIELVASDGRSVPPDVVIPTRFQHYAIWFGVPSGTAVLSSTGKNEGLPQTTITLRSGRIERSRLELRPLPQLKINHQVPAALSGHTMDLSIDEVRGGRVANWTGPASDVEPRLFRVPPREFEVSMAVGGYSATERVDLRAGVDSEVTIKLNLVELVGRVTSRNAAQVATLGFVENRSRKPFAVSTDEEGRFRTVLAVGDYDVRVELAGRDRSYLVGPEHFDASREYNVDLPANRYIVRVVDAETGEGVPSASVTVSHEDGELGFSEVNSTDEAGVMRLEPLRQGELKLIARKKGYLQSRLLRIEVESEAEDRELKIELEPEGKTEVIVLRLPDGSFAEGARVCIVPSSSVLAWTGAADREGHVDIPERYSGALAVALHPASGFLAFPVPVGATTLDLPMRAGEPLRAQVVGLDGKPVLAGGAILWSRGMRLSGAAVACAAPGENLVAPDGVFSLSTAPREGLEVLFFQASEPSVGLAMSGALDSRRVPVPYPWPRTQTIPAE